MAQLTKNMNEQGGVARSRAAKACKRCHQRRVKCDATEKGIPCSTCIQHNIEPCVLIESKRGTYQRRKQLTANAKSPRATQSIQPAPIPSPQQSSALDQQAQLAQQASPALSSGSEAVPVDLSHEVAPQPGTSQHPDNSARIGTPATLQGPGFQAPARRQHTLEPSVDYTSVDDSSTGTPASSYAEISWSSMFEHFLKSHRQNDKEVIDKCSLTYLGESFPMSMVLEGLEHGGKVKVHHRGPTVPKSETLPGVQANSHPDFIPAEDIECLKAKGAFDYPAPETMAAFKDIFLGRVYPLYPIVNRQEFIHQYETESLPWILLQSFCFAAATFCPLSVLYRAGFDSRRSARFSYHSKAKALFDTGYEVNKVVNLQSIILLSFWAGGPNSHWNFYSWISQGVTIAESLGIHRSIFGTNISAQDRSLLKRLWWMLVVRDTSCGELIGRPFRINLLRSDIERLTLEDFLGDMESPEFADHPLRSTYGLYHIHMCRLSLILREIVSRRFDPGQRGDRQPTSADFNNALKEWRYQLPPELNWNDDSPEGEFRLLPSSLSLMYHHHLILTNLCRSTALSKPHHADCGLGAAGHCVDCSAQHVLTRASIITRKSAALLMPRETYSAIFLAQVAFYIQLKSPQRAVSMLGRSAIAHCQTIWHSVADAWDSAYWFMQMFDNLLANTKDSGSSNSSDPQSEISMLSDILHRPSPMYPQANNLGQLEGQRSLDDESWANFSILPNLFDASGDQTFMQPSMGIY